MRGLGKDRGSGGHREGFQFIEEWEKEVSQKVSIAGKWGYGSRSLRAWEGEREKGKTSEKREE